MHSFRRRVVRRTTLISVFLLGILIGLFLAFFGFKIDWYWLLTMGIFIPFIPKKRYVAVAVLLVIGLSLGTIRGQVFYTKFKRYEPFYSKPVTVQGVVKDDSGFDQSTSQTQFHIGSIVINETPLIGRLQVITREEASLTRGDLVVVSGKLKPSKGTSRQGSIANAQVRVVAKNSSKVEAVRSRFFKVTQQSLPEPQASLGLGYLVGVRVSIPKELEDQLSIVGLTHIVAVSGYNLTVIVQAVRSLLGKKSAYQSVVVAGLLVVSFLVITGGSAPIIRAAVICAVSLTAWYYGRAVKPVLLLLLSGAVTAFVNPLYVWGDPGWYLSFLAFAGVLIVAPLIVQRYFHKREPGVMAQILLETLCAQLCTIPYTLFLFGGVSVIAPVANVVVLPFIPFIMLMMLCVGLVGMLFPAVAIWIGIIPSALLSLQVWLIQKLSSVPGAHAEVHISVLVMVMSFVGILLWVIMLHLTVLKRNNKQRRLQETDLL